MKQSSGVHQDIIASVHEILHASYLKESTVFNLLPYAVYVCDAEGTIVNYNRKAIELWGRTPTKDNSKERFSGAYKIYYADGRYLPHHETAVAACLKDGLPRENIEVIIERPDFSRIIVNIHIVAVKDEQGNILGAIICFYDITQQKEIKKELDWKTRELQDYVDNATIGLHWVDSNGIILWANKAELDMFGYSSEEYIGHNIAEFHVSQIKINDILKRLSCNETLHAYESIIRCKDGSVKTVHISSNVFWDNGEFIHTRCFTIDVTEQKKLFHALKDSEATYRGLLNSLPSGVYTCNKEGKITFFNEVAVELWGYRPNLKEDALKFCACYKVKMPDGTYLLPEQTPMAIALQTGQDFRNVEAVVERPDGSKFYASVNIDLLKDDEGNITDAINIFQDITNLKRAELALKESESKYRNLIEKLDTPLYTTDKEGKITLYNKAAANLWGREPEIGKDLWCGSYKIFKPDGTNLPLDSCPMAVCLKEQRAVYGEEILVVRPDGSLRNVAPYPQPLFDDSGNLTGAVNMLVDITEFKSNEQALRESQSKYRELVHTLEKKVEDKTTDLKIKNTELKQSEERYHKMIDEVEDYAIILLDKNGIVQNWNKGAEKIKGYKEEEIVGKNFNNFYLPDDREMGLPEKLLKQATQKGKALHEGWRRRKNGSRFWGSIVLTALHDDANNLIGFSKVTRDLTERKLAEDKLKEHTNKLEFQNKELEQFTYASSHDLKEPLRKIRLYNSAILDNANNTLDEKSKEYLTRSVNAAKRMASLIEALLSYSKTTSNIDSFEPVDLNEVMEEIMLMHKEEFEQKNVSIEMKKLPVIYAIPFQVKQLMFNLINNSIKYKHPERDVCIKVKTELVNGSEINEPAAEQFRQYQKISVIDNGIGFQQHYAEKVFNIFQRLNNLPSASGSGIGLAICKKIVQNHDGFIKALGKENNGARFDIYLPMYETL
jgi:PAS domain S-box-containing protein